MTQHPFPGSGHDGDEPVPGVPARDWAAEDDRYLDWVTAEVDAGRIEVPPEDPPPAATVSLGEAGDVDLGELARMAGGLSGTGFAQDQAADMMPPGPVPGALASQAVDGLASLPGDKLTSVILAARRLQARDEYLELAAVARRRDQQYEASKARGDKPRHREGEFAAEELGMDLNCSHYAAGKRVELADGLASRLPATFAGMAAGTIDGYKAKTIYEFTRFLSDEQAAEADKILAAAAPGMAPARLKQKAARLEMRLDPDGVRQRKEEAARKHRRVEARQEASGNASLAGRELDVVDALAAKNAVWTEATRLRNAGLDAPLRDIRSMVYLDRLQNLDPWDRLTPPCDPPGGYDEPSTDSGRFPDDGYEDEDKPSGEDEDDGEDGGDGGSPGGPGGSPPPGRPEGKAPLPAQITIIVSDGTLPGWSDAPAGVGGLGLPGPGAARDVVAAASRHPRTRWCVTVLGKDGEAIAHGCSAGRHPWVPPPVGNRDGPASPRDGTARAGPDDHQRAQLAELLRQLGITLVPIAKGECDHRQREDRYRPGRKLQHLVRARTTTCPRPAATPRRSTMRSTTRYRTPPEKRTNVIFHLHVPVTITRNTRQAGNLSSRNQALCAGRSPAAASTPPGPPGTTNNHPESGPPRCYQHRNGPSPPHLSERCSEMRFSIPAHPYGALSLLVPGQEERRAQAHERMARLAAIAPEQLPMALAFLSDYYPCVFDAILDAVEPCAEGDIGDDTPDQEPFCMKCGAPVGIFLAHGKGYRHYRGVLTATSKPRPYKADHIPVVGWRSASDAVTAVG